MKMVNKKSGLSLKNILGLCVLTFMTLFASCDLQMNENILYGTVGNHLEKIAPGKVTQLTGYTAQKYVKLTWVNPTDKDLYGLKLSVYEGESTNKLFTSVSLTLDSYTTLPQEYIFYNLTTDVQYTFEVMAFDRNLNFSAASSIPAKPSISVANYRVEKLIADKGNCCSTLSWKNSIFENFYGVQISIDPLPEGISGPISYTDDDPLKIPEMHTFYNLENGKTYTVEVVEFDKDLNFSNSASTTLEPTLPTNNISVKDLSCTEGDHCIELKWTNPTEENFYGIKIEASPAEGSLALPVYYINENPDLIPESYLATNLTNLTKYQFTIKTLDRNLTLGNAVSNSETPRPSENNIEVTAFDGLVFNNKIMLYWTNPKNTSEIDYYEITVSPSDVYKQPVKIYKDAETNQFPGYVNIDQLTNDVSYSFTLRTVDCAKNKSEGVNTVKTPNSGSSGVSANEELFPYKTYKENGVWKNHLACDFGYRKTSITKTLSFVSSTTMDLTTTKITSVMGNTNAYTVTGYTPEDGQVDNATEFSVSITYTPSEYNPENSTTASWDEADIKIGGLEENTIRLIGSNFPQPKDISTTTSTGSRGVKLWLRADMISAQDLDSDAGYVKLLPDYASKNGHGATSTAISKRASFAQADSDFNGLPAVDFSTNVSAQLLSAGTSEDPLVDSTDGITAFVVFKYTSNSNFGCVLSANYGTSFPILKADKKICSVDNGVYNASNYITSLSVRGNSSAMKETTRMVCISDSLVDDNNRLLPLMQGSTKGASPHGTYTSTLSACMRYSGSTGDEISQNSTKRSVNVSSEENYKDYPSNVRQWINTYKDTLKDSNNNIAVYPSNLRMWLNNDERFLGYIYGQSSPYKQTEEDLFNNNLTTFGVFGRPVGNGIGYRFGSITQMKVPTSTDKSNYDKFLAGDTKYAQYENGVYKQWLDEIVKVRKYDYAYGLNSLYSTGAADSNNNATSNWMSNDLWYTGKIIALTVGPDYSGGGTSFYGKVAEVIIFDYPLSESEIDDMNNYIKYRYNIQTISSNPSDYDF